jgi:tetratricopeptide (TPR) repeat protein
MSVGAGCGLIDPVTGRAAFWERGRLACTTMLATFALLLILQAGSTPRAGGTANAPDVQAHVGRGYELEKDERFATAADEFEAALALAPQLDRIRYQLGVCYFALGRDDDARREFELLRRQTHHDPSVIYFIGRISLAQHDFDGAIREFQSVAKQPPFPDTAYYLGAAYLEKGDLAASEKWLRLAEPLSPRDFRIPDHLARIYQREGRSADAEKEYARAAGLRENYNNAAVQAVACSRALETGAVDAARDACGRLRQPDDPDRLTLLGMIYGQHGRYEDAIAPLQRAAALDPDSYEIEHNLGLTFFRLKRYREARAPLERAVALRPDFFDSNALLGATLFLLKDDLKAYSVLHHAHALNPEDRDTAELLFKLASILAARDFGAENYPDAAKYLLEAESLRPQDPEVHARLADLYSRTGDPIRAESERQTAEKAAGSVRKQRLP